MNIIGTSVNGYEIKEFVDSGGFGSVYLAIKDGKKYAIKIFREDYILKEYREKGERNRIKREIDIMKSVNHEYLIRYVDDFNVTMLGVHSYFLVMEYAEGKTLRKLLNEQTLTEESALSIFYKLLEGILALHNVRGDDDDKGIIHRDLKPENIIVNSNGGLKIIDFGIKGLILKTCGVNELENAIHNVMSGENYFSNELLRKIINTHGKTEIIKSTTGKLTNREFEVLQQICLGLSTEEIAEKLFISPKTIKSHKSNLLEKTVCKNTPSLILFAIRNKMVEV